MIAYRKHMKSIEHLPIAGNTDQNVWKTYQYKTYDRCSYDDDGTPRKKKGNPVKASEHIEIPKQRR